MIPDGAAVAGAVAGPAVASLGWLLASRSRRLRLGIGGLLALAAHGGAWLVVARAYRGAAPDWRGLNPDLLGATILVLTEVAALLVLLRSERIRPGDAVGVVVGMGAAMTAVAYASYATNLALLALVVPLPTLAVLAAGLVGGRRGLAGIGGLAAADVLILSGFSLTFAQAGTAQLSVVGGGGPLLLLAGAAVKCGIVPGIGAWSLSAQGGSGAPLLVALRGQAVVLVGIAFLRVAGAAGSQQIAVGAAVAILVAGVVAVAASRPPTVLAAVPAAGAGLLLFAAGLGGSVGARAFLLLFPAFLVAAAVADLLADHDDVVVLARGRGGAGAIVGVALVSLLGLPPGGAFPGAWLTLHLAAVRSVSAWVVLLIAGAALLGLALAFYGGATLLRRARGTIPALVGAGAAVAFLLYLGVAPVRLGLGWLIRVERTLALPEVLASAGPPEVPPVGEAPLAAAVLIVAVVALLFVALGRGVRAEPEELPTTRSVTEPGGLRGRALRIASTARTRTTDALVGPVLVVLLLLAVAALATRLVLVTAAQGFL